MIKIKNALKKMEKGKLLELLIDNLADNNDYFLQSGQWNSNEQANIDNLITNERYEIRKAQITRSINYYIDKLTNEELSILSKILPNHTSSPSTGTTTAPASPKPSPSPSPEEKTILFFAANPSQQAELKLKDEFAVISRKLQDSDVYELKSFFAGSMSEFIDAIDEYKPSIIHFSGHGEKGEDKRSGLEKSLSIQLNDGAGLVFHDRDKRGYQVLGTESSQKLFKKLKKMQPQISVVLLNACYSRPQAIAISKNDIYTIGSKISIQDEAAIEFSDGFYKKYEETNDIVKAVNYGILKATAIDFTIDENIFLFHNGAEITL